MLTCRREAFAGAPHQLDRTQRVDCNTFTLPCPTWAALVWSEPTWAALVWSEPAHRCLPQPGQEPPGAKKGSEPAHRRLPQPGQEPPGAKKGALSAEHRRGDWPNLRHRFQQPC
eukprot:363399-Chlamydomonas_euryale.AAC.3